MTINSTGIAFYDHVQDEAATTWTIDHGLGHYPIIDVLVDYQGSRQKVLPLSIISTTADQTLVTFSIALTGSARLI